MPGLMPTNSTSRFGATRSRRGITGAPCTPDRSIIDRTPMRIAAAVLLAFAALAAAPGAQTSTDLQSLVDAERAFAAAARVTGWREAFLAYFADDAVTFTPEPT